MMDTIKFVTCHLPQSNFPLPRKDKILANFPGFIFILSFVIADAANFAHQNLDFLFLLFL